MNKFFKIITINISIFFLLVFCIEIFFGDWFKKQNWGNSLRSERLKKIPYTVEFSNKNYSFIYKKNSLGFRGDEIEPNKLKILMMGGSTTNQRFTPQELTIVGNLNDLFKADDANIELFNGGVDGQSTIGLINNFTKWFPNIKNFNPKVIIYYIGVNERFYYDYDPNPINFTDGDFKTIHAFDKMMKTSHKDQISDYIKNNSFFMKKGKIIQLKYFPSRLREKNFSEFRATYFRFSKSFYDLAYGFSENFYEQEIMDQKFDTNHLKEKNKIYYDSLSKRLEYLFKLTHDIGAEPIFINQVMNDGQLSEQMYYTNFIIRDFCLSNKVKFIDVAKNIVLDKYDFYDEFHTTPTGSKKVAEFIYPSLAQYLIDLDLID